MSPTVLSPEIALKILIVEDDPATRLLLATLARQIGHRIVLAENGADAVKIFSAEQPDIVLMDILMPVMDGNQAMAEIRAIAGERWVPILFVTTVGEIASHIDTLGQGADDYLVKPVHEAVLRAKLEVVRRNIGLHRQLETNNRELQNYHDAAEREMRVVKDLMARLVHHDHLSDPMLEHWILPATTFSGDLVAAARTPGGVLHVMLADGAGHGLAAALNVLPITPCFYTMTAKGLDIELIAATLNRTIREHLPIDRFVAATLIAVDCAARRVKIWNGGNPPLLALNADGEVFARFPSRNLALGILPSDTFSAAAEIFEYTKPCQLFAYSDGVVEGFDSATVGSGQQAVEGLLCGVPLKVRMKLLRSRVLARHFEQRADDDVTLLLVRCEDEVAIDAGPVAGVPAQPLQPASERKFEITLTAADFRELDVVSMLADFVVTIPAARAHCRQVCIVLSELYANALDHGVLGLSSDLKEGPDGVARYAEKRAAALLDLKHGSIAVGIHSLVQDGRPALAISFCDSGRGFDFSGVTAGPAGHDLKPHGRGITLVRALCARVEYRGRGSEVSVCYHLDAPAMDVADDVCVNCGKRATCASCAA